MFSISVRLWDGFRSIEPPFCACLPRHHVRSVVNLAPVQLSVWIRFVLESGLGGLDRAAELLLTADSGPSGVGREGWIPARLEPFFLSVVERRGAEHRWREMKCVEGCLDRVRRNATLCFEACGRVLIPLGGK